MIKIPPPPGFDVEAHKRHIATGGCPVVEGKTWCNGRNDDLHREHYALHQDPPPSTRVFRRYFNNPALIDHESESKHICDSSVCCHNPECPKAGHCGGSCVREAFGADEYRECDNCQQMYFATTKNQRWCSKKCKKRAAKRENRRRKKARDVQKAVYSYAIMNGLLSSPPNTEELRLTLDEEDARQYYSACAGFYSNSLMWEVWRRQERFEDTWRHSPFSRSFTALAAAYRSVADDISKGYLP